MGYPRVNNTDGADWQFEATVINHTANYVTQGFLSLIHGLGAKFFRTELNDLIAIDADQSVPLVSLVVDKGRLVPFPA